jgi:hypothetical protein
MDCECVPLRGWMCNTKYLSAFQWGMVVGARCTSLCQEMQQCWVFHTQQFPMCLKNGPPPEGHRANLKLWEALKSTWASLPVECFRLHVDSIS